MRAASCELRIENMLNKLDGIINAKVAFSDSTVYLTYNESIIGLEAIIGTIEKLDYSRCGKRRANSREGFHLPMWKEYIAWICEN